MKSGSSCDKPTGVSSERPSTIYGPVDSWRLGRSLGVDLLFQSSICSFRCTYCQLGRIEVHTRQRQVFVTTERVLDDLAHSDWQSADVLTLSGSGEPTLALNLGEVIAALKLRTDKPVMVLTNSTLLQDQAVRAELCLADKVFCKLDAATERTFQLIDRPVDGLTLADIQDGIRRFRAEYRGYLAIQMMFTTINLAEVEAFSNFLRELQPDEVQLNTPLRPVPRGWYLDARGNHRLEDAPYPSVPLKHLDPDTASELVRALREKTGLKVVSVYREPLEQHRA